MSERKKYRCPRCGQTHWMPIDWFPVVCRCGVELDIIAENVIISQEAGRPSTLYVEPERTGVGTEFKKLANTLGFVMPGCSRCAALMSYMNRIGVEKCEEQFDKILTELEQNALKYGWVSKFKAAGNALKSGLWISLDPFNPIESLLRIAIENEKLNQRTSPPAGA